MYNFFIDEQNFNGDTAVITGDDFNHVKNVLRLKTGDNVLVSVNNFSHLAVIDKFSNDSVLLSIVEKNFQDTTLPIELYLFQGLPKSDKLELIIQKAVELGTSNVIPVKTSRSITKIEQSKVVAKTLRWQKIAESAGKQCKLSFIPTVHEPLSFSDSLKMAQSLDLIILPYENKNGMADTLKSLRSLKKGCKVGVFIGPEGGFSDEEIDLAVKSGANIVSLGKRILRTETASITALSMLMLYAEMKL